MEQGGATFDPETARSPGWDCAFSSLELASGSASSLFLVAGLLFWIQMSEMHDKKMEGIIPFDA